jgi:hypothetical protein
MIDKTKMNDLIDLAVVVCGGNMAVSDRGDRVTVSLDYTEVVHTDHGTSMTFLREKFPTTNYKAVMSDMEKTCKIADLMDTMEAKNGSVNE